jgi:hypothetical protein
VFSFDSVERELSLREVEDLSLRKFSAAMFSSQSQLNVNIKRRISDGNTDLKKQIFVKSSQNDQMILICKDSSQVTNHL